MFYTHNYGYNDQSSANVAELVDALDLGSSRLSCESSSLSIRTTFNFQIPSLSQGRQRTVFSYPCFLLLRLQSSRVYGISKLAIHAFKLAFLVQVINECLIHVPLVPMLEEIRLYDLHCLVDQK